MYVFTGVVFLTLFLIHLYHFCLFFSPFYKQPQHRLTKRNLGLCWLYTGGKVLCLAICLSVWRIDMKQMVCTSTHHVGHHTLKNASLLDSE
ncbi:PREDICTED: uncharacterized protein LOC104766513 isoform X2 [Camelina sativa]|uniref:Uncharacterized protein LOC104766513 isoform X2 n=1 Tax=Camelina sativa TaxID=90675 RepID=A0ABM0XNY1_CAMSA|nr:PREDICTED: uncharacterized protein LOC104766513 isoform X2 [Camelina sativa]